MRSKLVQVTHFKVSDEIYDTSVNNAVSEAVGILSLTDTCSLWRQAQIVTVVKIFRAEENNSVVAATASAGNSNLAFCSPPEGH